MKPAPVEKTGRESPQPGEEAITQLRGVKGLRRVWADRELLWRVLSFMRPFLRWHMLGLVLTFATSVLSLVQPWIYRLLIDKVLIERNTHLLLEICLVYLGATLLSSFVSMSSSLLFHWLGQRTGNDLRMFLHERIFRLSIAFTGRKRLGDLISCFTSDIPAIQGLFTSTISTLIGQMISFTVLIIVLFNINSRLTMLAIPSIPFFAVILAFSSSMLKGTSRHLQESNATFTSILQEQISGLKTSAAFCTELRERLRFRDSLSNVLSASMKMTIRGFVLEGGFLLASVTLILVMWLGGQEVIQGRMQVGMLVAYVSYFGMLFGPIGAVASLSVQTIRSLGAAERVFGIADAEPEVVESPGAVELGEVEGSIEFRGVSFTYPTGSVVFKDFDLLVEPKDVVLIKGESGAGKTTLVSLLLRFWDPDEGEILLDGRPIRDFKLESLRRKIGVVLQDSFLYHASVRDNILLGDPAADERDVFEAARAAGAHDFVMELPEGYDTIIGERGSNLSGGQIQRIALARVFLKNPPIVILDEATNALDASSEDHVRRSILRLLEGRTCIIITHHHSSWSHCTRVFDISRGEDDQVSNEAYSTLGLDVP